jgi:hypothetical protein
MIKAVDRTAVIEQVRLLTKSGGKSGTYDAQPNEPPSQPIETAKATRRKASPQVLIHEVAAPKAVNTSSEREALRTFMFERRLRATEWAKTASVPVNELYGYLSGRARTLPAASAERLAKAARVSIDIMFGRKTDRQ